ncbi:siderophore-iron reductase FhuF [Shinella sp.]|uniref:siderophore-iron reductase FhuF n=1 Tax=Shinella sp. TaxID=1870904 RepID=UPI0029ADE7AC|nr:siderophore-iron reductase FhuF [Shinella sp.]MDX3975565.1 siderophore-iron reductase FhuF [Shinella sp.]
MMLSSDLDGAVPLGDFLAGDGFSQTLDRYAEVHGGADRRAVASFWSLYYFSALTIPYVVARRAEITPPIALDEMTIAIGEDGLPRAFGLPHEGEWSESTDLVDVITPLVDCHLARAVALFKEKTGIAPKLAWNNAAVYIDYAFNATDRSPANGDDHWPSRPLFDRPQLTNGSRNPFHGCLRHEMEDGAVHCRRKVCCLRYMLPGIPGCGELCALPELRKQ